MIRKMVEWVLYKLKLKKREDKGLMESLLELAPLVFALVIVVGAAKWLGFEFPPLKWHRRMLLYLKRSWRRFRFSFIGY